MKKFLLIHVVIYVIAMNSQGQSAGDYRSMAAGDWTNSATWQRFNGSVWVGSPPAPTASDGVITIQSTGTVTITSPITADQLVIIGGATLDISSTLTVNDGPATDLTLNGTISGSGSVIDNGSMDWPSGSMNVNLTVAGTTSVTSGATKILGNTFKNNGTIIWSGGTIQFNTGGTIDNLGLFDNSFDGSLALNSGGPITNELSGTFRKSGGTGTTSLNVPMTNHGIVQVMTGAINTTANAFTNDGQLDISALATFNNTGTMSFSSLTSLTGNGTLGLSGTENLNATITSPSTLKDSIGGGTLMGAGELDANGPFLWNVGTIAAVCKMAGTSTFPTGNLKVLSSSMTNSGTVTWSGGSIQLNAGGVITNNGSFDNSFDGFFFDGGGGSVVNSNTGIYRKTGGTLSSTVGVPMTNNGTIDVLSGTMNNTGTNFVNNGTIDITSPATFSNSGTMTFGAGTVLSGTGTLAINSTENLNTAVTAPNTLTVSKSGGNISGLSIFTVNGAFNWTGGTLSAAFVANGTSNFSTGSTKTLASSLTNNGTVTWSAGTIQFNAGSTMTNAGLFDNNFDGSLSNGGGGSITNTNTGTFRKSAGTLTTNLQIPMTSNGIVEVLSGTLSCITTNFSNNGTINVTSPGIFNNANIMNFGAGAILTGNGTLTLNATENINAPVSAPASMIVSKSGGTMAGANSFTVAGTFNWTGGTINNPFFTNGTGNVSGGATKLLGGTMTNNGAVTWSGGSIQFNSGGIFVNNGLFDNTVDLLMSVSGGGPFHNAASGTLRKSAGAATTTVNVNITNDGVIEALSGTLLSAGTTTNNNEINTTSPGVFSSSGTLNFNSGTLLTGTGTLTLGGTENVNTPVSSPNTLTLNKNTGTLQGASGLTLNGTFNWSGGTISASIINNGTATFISGATKILANSFTNNGGITWSAGSLQFNAGSSFSNVQIFDCAFDGLISNSSGGAITNSGTFKKSATSSGTTTINPNFNNSGLLQGIGTFQFSGTFTNMGTIAPGLSPGILTINGAQPFSSNSSLDIELFDGSGPGTGNDQLQRNGSITLTGTLNAVETGSVPLGTYTILSLSSGTITGTFTTTNIPSGYNIAYNSTSVVLTKVALPLTLLSFGANASNGEITLSWQTAHEVNTKRFLIERGSEGKNFFELGTVNAAGNSAGNISYSFIDLHPLSGNNFYRLKMQDIDGAFRYSSIIRVNEASQSDRFNVYPNPASGSITVSIPKNYLGGELRFLDVVGREYVRKTGLNQEVFTIDMSKYPAGVYWILLVKDDQTKILKLIRN